MGCRRGDPWLDLQDQITFVLQEMKGVFDVEAVLDMDLLSFRSLHNTCERLAMSRRIDTIYDVYTAAQCKGKDVNKYVRDLAAVVLPQTLDPKETDAKAGRAAFRRDFMGANRR